MKEKYIPGKHLKMPNETFCILPWVSIETTPVGTFRACCLSEDDIVDEKGKIYRVNDNLQTVRNSEYMNNLRQQFLDGKKPANCQKCWQVEDSGGKSKRNYSVERLEHMGISDTWTATDAKPLMFVDFKLGNICNLKCRICGSWSSSQYANDELSVIPKAQQKDSIHYKILEWGRWPRDAEQFWKGMEENINNMRYLEFTGGEPFLIQEHFDFLQILVDKGVAPNIEIHYNTNGTQWPEKNMHLWRHFKHVEIAFSIDAVGERYNYQRKNADWEPVNANIAKFQKLKKDYGNISLQSCSTVSVLNIFYLEELAEWLDQQNFNVVHWNMLHEIWYMSIAHLNETAKMHAVNTLMDLDPYNRHKADFNRFIKFMEQGESRDSKDLCDNIRKFDLIRNESLWDHHETLAKWIGYERT